VHEAAVLVESQPCARAEPTFLLKPDDAMVGGAEPRILVVDDHEETLELYRLFFEFEGYAVTLSAAGGPVPGLIAASQPDVVILDLVLPDVPGERLLQSIRANPATRALPVVICSGASLELERLGPSLRELGCTILMKPFDLDALLAVVRQACGSAGARQSGSAGERERA
jgi:DNA-binding response OmpR family regulator